MQPQPMNHTLPPFEPVPPEGVFAALGLLQLERSGPVFHLRLNRPAKRNSVSDELLLQIHTVVLNLPKDVRVLVISGAGEHFCAGLDLSEVSERTVAEGMVHSRAWHACFDALQYGPVPVIAVLHGAVVGGGLELASSAHLRVAEDGTFYALPEGTRGIFVGGGGSVRISRLMGTSRMTDMMLTGRSFDADEGQAFGLSNYRVAAGAVIALITDAGTPSISDPGFRVTRECRKRGLTVSPLPGPCAIVALLSASGLPTNAFRFVGFLPPKSAARRRFLEEMRTATETVVLHESCHRIGDFLDEMLEILGPERVVCVGRELTKLHETIRTAALKDLVPALKAGSLKGEFTVALAPADFAL